MLADLAQAIRNYLHDVFVIQFSWWVVLGFVAQAMFFMRFAVHWVASERAGRSVVPTAFWIFSVIGGLLLLIYALQRKDPVFIAGLALSLFIYLRNHNNSKPPAPMCALATAINARATSVRPSTTLADYSRPGIPESDFQ
jgi:lipid-A-disaccharide synthase-like uncharacterized protein